MELTILLVFFFVAFLTICCLSCILILFVFFLQLASLLVSFSEMVF